MVVVASATLRVSTARWPCQATHNKYPVYAVRQRQKDRIIAAYSNRVEL